MTQINENNYVTATVNDFKREVIDAHTGSYVRHTYIGSDEYVFIPRELDGEVLTNYRQMFAGTAVKGVASDSPHITSMAGMFRESTAPSLDLTGLSTFGVTDMAGMFRSNRAIVIQTQQFDTSRATNMSAMFMDAQAQHLDLRNFNTSRVTDMSDMFRFARAETIDMSSFNTSSVTDMSYMFSNTHAEALDVLNFDTSLVTDFGDMFSHSAVRHIDLSSFQTRNSPRARYMFDAAQAQTIKLNSTTFSATAYRTQTQLVGMFRDTINLKELDISTFGIRSGAITFIGGTDLTDFLTGSGVEQVYVKDSTARRRVNSAAPRSATVEVGGEGYTEPVIREPLIVTDFENQIKEVLSSEETRTERPYQTQRIMNRTWEENREDIQQEGEDGYRIERVVVYLMQDGTERTQTTTIESVSPTTEIIEYGTIVSEETDTERTEYPFETETYNDYELNYPREEIKQAGEVGFSEVTTRTITHSDGKVEEIVEDSEQKAPVNEIIAIGMIDRQTTVNETTELPFDVELVYDDSLKYNDGEPHILESGRDGSLRQTFEVTVYVDETPDKRVLHHEKTVREEPETEIQAIGLIDYITEEDDHQIEEFDIVEIYDKDLLVGEERLVEEGVNGSISRTFERTVYIEHPETGQKQSDKVVELRDKYEYVPSEPQVIAIGSQEPIKSTEERTETVTIPREVKYVDAPELYEGQEVIDAQGSDGNRERRYQIVTFFDDSVQEILINETITEPEPKVIRRGTKDPVIGRKTETEEHTIPYDTVQVSVNEPREERPGVIGLVVDTYEVLTYFDDTTKRRLIDTERVEPVSRIVYTLTDRLIKTSEEAKESEMIAYDVVYVDDDTLYIGEERIEVRGQHGQRTKVYIVTEFEDGGTERVHVDTLVVEPVDKVIHVGTKEPEEDGELVDLTNENAKMTGGWLYLEDGDQSIRASVPTKIRPVWAYL